MLTRTRLALSAWTMQIMYSSSHRFLYDELEMSLISKHQHLTITDNVFGNNHLVLDASRAV